MYDIIENVMKLVDPGDPLVEIKIIARQSEKIQTLKSIKQITETKRQQLKAPEEEKK